MTVPDALILASLRRIERTPSVTATMPKLTHPDRVLWPGEPALTKRDLAEYLIAVAPLMIGHIHGRPCSFVRAPDGITGELFFQRHPREEVVHAAGRGEGGVLVVRPRPPGLPLCGADRQEGTEHHE